MNPDIEQLKKEVSDLEEFRKSIDQQQITFPLDKKSIDVVHKDVIVPTGNVVIPAGLVSYNESVEILLKGKKYLIVTTAVQ